MVHPPSGLVTWNTSESGPSACTASDPGVMVTTGPLGLAITSPTLTSDLVMGVGSTVATTDDPSSVTSRISSLGVDGPNLTFTVSPSWTTSPIVRIRPSPVRSTCIPG